jgi:hypothetical protein
MKPVRQATTIPGPTPPRKVEIRIAGRKVRNGKPLRASPIAIRIAEVTAMTQIVIG